MKKITIIILILSCSQLLFAGGPWPQSKGKGYFKLSEWWLVFDQHYTDAGIKDPNVTTGIFNTAFYGEYGISNRLTVIAYVPFFSRTYMNNVISATTGETLIEGEAINGLGDTDVGLKYSLNPERRIPVSLSILLGLPLGNDSGGSQKNLQTGDGEFNQVFQLDLGHGYQLGERTAAYVSAYGGFNNRSNGFSDEIRYGFEAGFGIIDQRLWLTGRLQGVESLKNGDGPSNITNTSIFSNNSEFSNWGVEAAFYLTNNLGLSVSVSAPFRGEIIAAGTSFSAGIFLDLSKS